MAVYTVKAPDGSTLELEGPENATNEQISAAALEAYSHVQKQSTTQSQSEPSLLDKVGDVFTGNLRATEQTNTLPYWTEMPEVRIDTDPTNAANWKSFLGTMSTSPDETVQIIKSNFPNVGVRQDEKGNYILKSGNGQEYAIAPGLKLGDIPRAAVTMGTFAPSAGAGGIVKSAAMAGLNQAGLEAAQYGAGGSFDAKDIATTAGLTAAIPLAGKGIGMGVNAIKQGAKALPEAATAAMNTADNINPAMQNQAEQSVNSASKGISVSPPLPAEMSAQVDNFAELAKKAKSGGIGSQKAKEQLAAQYDLNKEAKDAFDSLGVDAPADLVSDNRLIQETVGLSRSIKGSESSVEWANFIENTRKKVDDALYQIDATNDIATASEIVKNNLNNIRDDLKESSKVIYNQIDDVMPLQTKADLSTTRSVVNQIADEMGGIDNISPAEKSLLQIATDPTTTYGRLKDVKSQIGAALGGARESNPYGGIKPAKLERLYSALANDQILLAENTLGKEAADNLKYANQLTAKRKQLEKRMIWGYGKDNEGSIAKKLTSALKSGSSSGDITGLKKVIDLVPKDLRKQTLLTGIMDQARTNKDQFSFGFYESMYSGLRKNAPVYNALAKEIGKDGEDVLRSIYVASKEINKRQALVDQTGKANQGLLNAFNAQNFVGKVLDSTAGKVATSAIKTASNVPGASIMLDSAASAIATAKNADLHAASKMLSSEEFAQLAADIAEKGAERTARSNAVKRLSISPKFTRWANAIGLSKDTKVRQEWIRNAIVSGSQFYEEEK